MAGSLFYGDNPTFNVAGYNRLCASGGLTAIDGSINLAANSHLVVTGSLEFTYADSLSGPANSVLVNNGTIQTADGVVSAPVKGHGTLGFFSYHDGRGEAEITSSIAHGQTVALNPAYLGINLTLTDPSTFHGILDITQQSGASQDTASVVLDGIQSTSFDVMGDRIILKDLIHPLIFSETQKNRHCLTEIPKRIERSR